MNPPINFDRERSSANDWERLFRNLHTQFQDVYRRLSGSGSANITVITGSGGSGGGGGSSSSAEYRSGALTGAAGAVIVSFSSAMSTSSYRVFIFVRDSSGALYPLDDVTLTKSTTSFSFTALEAITGYYLAIADN